MNALPNSACARRRQRGYTLVEIMIVLVASALLASGPILLVYNKLLDDNYASARRQLELVKGRIVDYASAHRTASRMMPVSSDRKTRIFSSEGRPYLPCPDINNDGIEDRRFEDVDVLPEVGAPLGSETFTGFQCQARIGFLPYVTLGTPAKDPFGSRIVYAVDLPMADALHGFGPLSQPSSIDESEPLEFLLGNDPDDDDEGPRWQFTRTPGADFVPPPTLCLGHPQEGTIDDGCYFGDLQGTLATTTVTVNVQRDRFSARKIFDVDSARTRDQGEDIDERVVEGLAFIVLSPGRFYTGHLYAEGYCSTDRDSSLGIPGYTDPNLTSAELSTGDEFNYLRLGRELCIPQGLSNSLMLYAVRDPAAYGGGRGTRRFSHFGDDQAVWMTAPDLSAEMQRLGVYPVKPQPLLISADSNIRDDRSTSQHGLRPSMVTVSLNTAVTIKINEDLPLGLLGGLSVELGPGDYIFANNSLMNPNSRSGTFGFYCEADPFVTTYCEILPPGGIVQDHLNLIVLVGSEPFEVTIPVGLHPLHLVTDPPPDVDNTAIQPW